MRRKRRARRSSSYALKPMKPPKPSLNARVCKPSEDNNERQSIHDHESVVR